MSDPENNEAAELVQHMVDRFLGWRLPENFNPDAGISFEPVFNAEYNAKRGQPPQRHEPTGTNLFDATQAEAMVRYMLDDLPATSSQVSDIAGRWYGHDSLVGYGVDRDGHRLVGVLADTDQEAGLRDVGWFNATGIAARVAALLNTAAPQSVGAGDEVELERYDAGLLGDGRGGNIEWWQDYLRAELCRAHEFYQDQASTLSRPAPAPDAVRGAAIEECARVAEEFRGRDCGGLWTSESAVGWDNARKYIAAAIRALKSAPVASDGIRESSRDD